MSYCPKQIKEFVIEPVLKDMELYSESAVELLLVTCAVESNFGQYLKQQSGPAIGPYQMEPDTFKDIFENFLRYRSKIKSKLIRASYPNFVAFGQYDPFHMIWNLRFSTAMARIHYYRVPEPLPQSGDVSGMWHYYKKYYNTYGGASTKERFIDCAQKYAGEVIGWQF